MIALSIESGQAQLQRTFAEAIMLDDAPIPATFPLPPQGFVVVKGRPARALWAQAKSNWINCHPQVARTGTDPRPIPGACRAGRWGGGR